MELIIKKNGHVFARSHDIDALESDVFELDLIADANMPAYPTDSAGKGKYWDLDYVDSVLTWIAKDRPLTSEERVAALEAELQATKILLGVDE